MTNMLKYSQAKWSMPFLFTTNSFFILALNSLLEGKSTIDYVFGSPKCKWAGGRVSNIAISSPKFIEKTVKGIINYNITPAFTFTNTGLTKEDINDKLCNEILKIISDYNCEVIIVSDLLYDYIREKFPNIKICASILKSNHINIKDIDETDHINSLIDKYDRVVIRPEYAINHNFDFSGLKDTSNLEILVNQYCAFDCYNSHIDYRIQELFDKGLISLEKMSECTHKICPRENNIIKKTNELTDKEVQKCIDSGITKLKLQGRHYGYNTMLYELFAYYFDSKINRKETEEKIDKLMLEFMKNSAELQLYSLICKKS